MHINAGNNAQALVDRERDLGAARIGRATGQQNSDRIGAGHVDAQSPGGSGPGKRNGDRRLQITPHRRAADVDAVPPGSAEKIGEGESHGTR